MSRISQLLHRVAPLKNQLVAHPLYNEVKTLPYLRVFMANHAYAVWDFMSLLKSIQVKVTCTQVPWIPSKNTQAVRFINEIVLGEECDDIKGDHIYISHYEMYLRAMREIGADTTPIEDLVSRVANGTTWSKALEENKKVFSSVISPQTFSFTKRSLQVAANYKTHQVVSYFLYGREDPIPDMFKKMVSTLEKQAIKADNFKLYLERHIEVDSQDHGPMSEKLLLSVCGEDNKKWSDVEILALEAIEERIKLWNGIHHQLQLQKLKTISMTSTVKSATTRAL
jgi:hypothetical protein